MLAFIDELFILMIVGASLCASRVLNCNGGSHGKEDIKEKDCKEEGGYFQKGSQEKSAEESGKEESS